MFFVFDFIPDWLKIEEMCDIVVSEDLFVIFYCPRKCKTQKIWDEAVED